MPATLPHGLYKIAFETPSGTEYGVAYLQDGKLRGGDSGMAYVGSYVIDGSLMSAELSVSQHRHVPGAVSALGFNDFKIEMHGLVDDVAVFRLAGSSPLSSSIRFQVRLSLLAD